MSELGDANGGGGKENGQNVEVSDVETTHSGQEKEEEKEPWDAKKFFTQIGCLVALFGVTMETATTATDNFTSNNFMSASFTMFLLVFIHLPTLIALLIVLLKDPVRNLIARIIPIVKKRLGFETKLEKNGTKLANNGAISHENETTKIRDMERTANISKNKSSQEKKGDFGNGSSRISENDGESQNKSEFLLSKHSLQRRNGSWTDSESPVSIRSQSPNEKNAEIVPNYRQKLKSAGSQNSNNYDSVSKSSGKIYHSVLEKHRVQLTDLRGDSDGTEVSSEHIFKQYFNLSNCNSKDEYSSLSHRSKDGRRLSDSSISARSIGTEHQENASHSVPFARNKTDVETRGVENMSSSNHKRPNYLREKTNQRPTDGIHTTAMKTTSSQTERKTKPDDRSEKLSIQSDSKPPVVSHTSNTKPDHHSKSIQSSSEPSVVSHTSNTKQDHHSKSIQSSSEPSVVSHTSNTKQDHHSKSIQSSSEPSVVSHRRNTEPNYHVESRTTSNGNKRRGDLGRDNLGFLENEINIEYWESESERSISKWTGDTRETTRPRPYSNRKKDGGRGYDIETLSSDRVNHRTKDTLLTEHTRMNGDLLEKDDDNATHRQHRDKGNVKSATKTNRNVIEVESDEEMILWMIRQIKQGKDKANTYQNPLQDQRKSVVTRYDNSDNERYTMTSQPSNPLHIEDSTIVQIEENKTGKIRKKR